MKIFMFTFILLLSVQAFPQSENVCGEESAGVSRKPGDSWQEDCNRCRCLSSGFLGVQRSSVELYQVYLSLKFVRTVLVTPERKERNGLMEHRAVPVEVVCQSV